MSKKCIQYAAVVVSGLCIMSCFKMKEAIFTKSKAPFLFVPQGNYKQMCSCKYKKYRLYNMYRGADFPSGHHSLVFSARFIYYTVMVIFLARLSIGATQVTMGHTHNFFSKCDNVCRYSSPPYCTSTNTFIDLNKRTLLYIISSKKQLQRLFFCIALLL